MATPFVAGTAALVLATLAGADGVYAGRAGEVKQLLLSTQEPLAGRVQRTLWSSRNITNGAVSMTKATLIAKTGNYSLLTAAGANSATGLNAAGSPGTLDGSLPLPATPPSANGWYTGNRSATGAGMAGWDGKESLYPHTVAAARVAGVCVRFYVGLDAIDSMRGLSAPLYATHALKGFDFHSATKGLEGVFQPGHPMEGEFVNDFGVKVTSQMWLEPGNAKFRVTSRNTYQLYINGKLVMDSRAGDREYVWQMTSMDYVDIDLLMLTTTKSHELILEIKASGDSKYREISANDVSLLAGAQVNGGWQHFFDATPDSSASLTTANAASNGLLIKAYSFATSPEPSGGSIKPPTYGGRVSSQTGNAVPVKITQMPDWDDSYVTRAGFITEFPGQTNGSVFIRDLTASPAVRAPFFLEVSGVFAIRQAGVMELRLQCEGACKLYVGGVLCLDQDGDNTFLEDAVVGKLSVTQPGPFPIRVLYLHDTAEPPALQISARLVGPSTTAAPSAARTQADAANATAQTPDFTTAWRGLPAELLFTDAAMEHTDMHTGSIAGLRVEVWPAGVDFRATTPMATRRLDVDKLIKFDLQSMLTGLKPGDYGIQIHGYSAVGAPYIGVQHSNGTATVYIGDVLVLVSSAEENGKRGHSRAASLPFIIKGNILYHFNVVFSRVRHDEVVAVLNDTTPAGNLMRPWAVDKSCWSDIRMTSASVADERIGKLGAFWMTYYPNDVVGYGIKLPNSLEGFTKHSWAASFHSSGAGTALDRPVNINNAGLKERIVRFSGYYRILSTGVQGLGLYCLRGDSILVILGGVTILENDDCKPFLESGIVFKIVPMYLPAGLYELEYTVRTRNTTTVMIAEVLSPAPGRQPVGRISAASAVLYMPASANDLIANLPKENSTTTATPIRVVDHGYGK